jgi:shikimate dehydrogenase
MTAFRSAHPCHEDQPVLPALKATPKAPDARKRERHFHLAGIIGDPVFHSRSPLIHNHWMTELGMPGAFVPIRVPIERLEHALRALPELGFAGCNLTVPHKVKAMDIVDSVAPEAARFGAVNCIVVEPDGALHGFNTDIFGYIENLKRQAPQWRPPAAPAVVLGAGGAGRAIVQGLVDSGATDIRLANRTLALAEEVAGLTGPQVKVVPWEEREEALDGAGLVVNTTSCGMTGKPPLELRLNALPISAVVSDIVYAPLETALLRDGRLRGNPVSDGLGMLLHQARPSFTSWFGVDVDVTPELRRKAEDSLA